MKKHSLFLLVLFSPFLLVAQTNVALQRFATDSLLRHANISFALRSLTDNETLLSYNAQLACTPASVTKLITTATALEVLKPDYRFETYLETDGFIDTAGCLQGNLYIVGNGDPTIGSTHFTGAGSFVAAWIKALKDKGITSINGNIIADVSLYDQNPIPMRWLREDIGNYYGAGVFPVSVFDNTMLVTLKSGGSGSVPEVIASSPDVNYTYINNLTVKPGATNDVYLLGEPYTEQRTLYGTMRENQANLSVKGDISNPPLFLAGYLAAKLSEAGMSVTGKPEAMPAKTSAKRLELYMHQSPTLAEIVKSTNMHSNNNFAEHLLKHLALQRSTLATMDEALRFVVDFWDDKGIDVSGLFLYDGSGLSPKNAICADFICDVLAYMKQKSAYADAFYASLPVAGRSGTVAYFLRNTSLDGYASVKSGSFKNVQSYAGYISKGGKDYVFCIIVNNFVGNRRKTVKLIEQLLTNEIG